MSKILKLAPWIGLIIFAGLWFYETNRMPEERPPGKEPKVEVPIETRFKDSAGNEHVVIKDGKNVIARAEIKNPERPRNIIDSSAALLKIATSEIQRVTRINSLTKDSLLRARTVINALSGQLAYRYKDKFVDLEFIPPIDTTGTGIFNFSYNADLNIVQYQKRKWFLGAKESFIDISSTDPRTTIRGVKQLTVKQKTPQFGLRLQASGNYNLYNDNAGFGPAIRVDIGRLSIQGNYMYYPKNKLWYPATIVNYDIIRF